MNERTRRLIAGLLTFSAGLALGLAATHFFRGPERTSVDPIVVEIDSGSDGEDARPGRSPGRGKKPPRQRPSAPAPSRADDGGAVPVPAPAPPPAGDGGDDDDDDAGDDDDDDDGTDD